MSAVKHQPATALPLKFLPDEGNFIVNAAGHIVAEVPCQGVENDKLVGAYLAHAANAYPKLVEALLSLERASLHMAQCWNRADARGEGVPVVEVKSARQHVDTARSIVRRVLREIGEA